MLNEKIIPALFRLIGPVVDDVVGKPPQSTEFLRGKIVTSGAPFPYLDVPLADEARIQEIVVRLHGNSTDDPVGLRQIYVEAAPPPED